MDFFPSYPPLLSCSVGTSAPRWLKANIDASLFGAGVVIRDYDGKLILIVSVPLLGVAVSLAR